MSYSELNLSKVDTEKINRYFELPRHDLKNFLAHQLFFVIERKNIPACKI